MNNNNNVSPFSVLFASVSAGHCGKTRIKEEKNKGNITGEERDELDALCDTSKKTRASSKIQADDRDLRSLVNFSGLAGILMVSPLDSKGITIFSAGAAPVEFSPKQIHKATALVRATLAAAATAADSEDSEEAPALSSVG